MGFILVLVGNHQGEILVFTIPKKGTNFVLKDTLAGMREKTVLCEVRDSPLGQAISMESPVSSRTTPR